MAGELKTIYNNQLIRTSTADDTFALNCNGKIMASDVTIQATDVDSLTVTYGGNTIATGSGTVTKILNCDGRVATSDIGVAVTMNSAPSYPVKGDTIKVNMDGTERNYIVVKMNGSVAEVVGLFNVGSCAWSTNNTYAGGTTDTLYNETWYNTLTPEGKAAIVDKTFRQDQWSIDATGNPVYAAKWGGGSGTPYNISLKNSSFGSQITRHVYALSVQDLVDFVDATPSMTYDNTTLIASRLSVLAPYTSLKLVTAATTSGNIIHSATGRINTYNVTISEQSRPALQIDLDKITWSKV